MVKKTKSVKVESRLLPNYDCVSLLGYLRTCRSGIELNRPEIKALESLVGG